MTRQSFGISLLLALGVAGGAYGQTAVIVQRTPGFEHFLADVVLPPDVTLPPGVTIPLRPGEAEGTNTAAKPTSPEDQRLQELLKLRFDRSSASIFDAYSAQLDRTRAATNEVQQFQQNVIRGDWPAVGAFLRTLPKGHGQQVYRSLLRQLPNAERPSAQPPGATGNRIVTGQPVRVDRNQPGPATISSPTLVLDDVLALAAIAPEEFTDEDAKALGRILGGMLTRGDALESLLPKLEKGVKHLGGRAPEDRAHAAEMLLAANRLAEAAPFLAPLATAREKLDWRALEQHALDLAARGKREHDHQLLAQAWDVNQFILGQANGAATNRDPALQRCLDLLPELSGATGTNWLRDQLRGAPATGLAVLAVVNELVQDGMLERDVELRQKNLALQKQAVDTLLAVRPPTEACWRAALNLLAQNWVQEARWAKQNYRPQFNNGAQFDAYGNIIGYRNYQPNYNANQNPFIPLEPLLAAAPEGNWQQQLDEGLRPGVLALRADLHLKTEKPDQALPLIATLAATQPEAATDLANSFLRAWATAHGADRNQQNAGRYFVNGVMYFGGNPYGNQSQGIPLTRARQGRNLQELSGVVRRLEGMRLSKLDDDALVAAFAAAHSPAEVFRVEDIEAVFGNRAQIKPDLLAGLAQTMRERLAQQWRQPRVQQEARTHRNDKQIEAEVLRGYELVLDLIDDAQLRSPLNWRLKLAQAATLFDLAEFQYGKQVDLAIYVEKREEAFKTFARAAELYAAALPQTEENAETPLVYQLWFNANLGASDLAYVTRQQEPETNQLQQIKTAILSLPNGAGARHLTAFAQQLSQSANSLRPELKPRYLRAGLKIVGDEPEAAEARELVAYYDDLLHELELVVRLDGDATVGHSQPFGVFVSLRHTADLEREAGGFGRYLHNNKSANPYYVNAYYGQQSQRNFPEDFEKQVREKLADHFDVKTVTFLDEKVKSRGYGRTGWRETPLAYLLLQARDGSVDQLPAFHMDLDFMDSRGQVVLPVESAVTLLDARPDRVSARPAANLELTEILDDRALAQGKLALEIKATGHGLVPNLTELVRTNFAGLRLEEWNDPGPAITHLDAEADELAPVSERNWRLQFAVTKDAPSPLEFKFPEPVSANIKSVYKRYADADLVEVRPMLALAGVPLQPRPWWHWLALATGLLALIGGAVWWLRKHPPTRTTDQPRYTLPEPVSAFSLIALLRRMDADSTLPWREADRAELGQDIRRLETHFFSRQRNGDPAPDLDGIGRRWVELAGNGKS